MKPSSRNVCLAVIAAVAALIGSCGASQCASTFESRDLREAGLVTASPSSLSA